MAKSNVSSRQSAWIELTVAAGAGALAVSALWLLSSRQSQETNSSESKWKIFDRSLPTFSSTRPQSKPKSKEEIEIERHIVTTQTPAKSLGIQVYSLSEIGHANNDVILELKAPLHLNTNVHGTAFAGSLYSVAVLTSYYLGRYWMHHETTFSTEGRIQFADMKLPAPVSNYTLVAKSASIQYRKPVTTPWIIARSTLPDQEVLDEFRKTLIRKGKATMRIDGTILKDPLSLAPENEDTPVVACFYSVEVCAYLDRNKPTLPASRSKTLLAGNY